MAELPPVVEVEPAANAVPAAEDAAQPQPKKRGCSGMPRGVQPVKGGKGFYARASWKPPGATKNTQRHLGTFATVEAAAAKVVEAEAQLNAGVSVWDEDARKNVHKRGEVCATHPRLRLRDGVTSGLLY